MAEDYSNMSRDEIVEKITRRRVAIDVDMYIRLLRKQIDDSMTAKEFLDVASAVFHSVIVDGFEHICNGV